MNTTLESVAPKSVRPVLGGRTALEFWAYCRQNQISLNDAATEAVAEWLKKKGEQPQEPIAS
ncbi:hypothetical protein ACQ4M4_12765 [Leptolyngbya sp. AN02str]|uniref:hypothetical protein n=1 Tax=Leptolyngbya sp. AN02str TaxID=3423363 RepID=UPI003D319039